jgi:hypothetical protein
MYVVFHHPICGILCIQAHLNAFYMPLNTNRIKTIGQSSDKDNHL